MHRIGAHEAKRHLPQLLERVSGGERITITRYGVPVARLVPVDPPPTRPLADTIAALKDFRKGRHLGDLSTRELIEQGRR